MTFRPMKPETTLRKAQERLDERMRRRREAVERLALIVARHEAKGDLIGAALFAELLVDAQARLDDTCAPSIVVGDHDPEPCT